MGRSAVRLSVVLHVGGELDLHTAAEFSDQFLDAAATAPAQGIVLDLSGVTFMDVAGLRAVTDAHDRLSDQGIRLRLHGILPPTAGSVPRPASAGVPSVLTAVPDLEAASGDCDEGVWSGARPEPITVTPIGGPHATSDGGRGGTSGTYDQGRTAQMSPSEGSPPRS